MTRKTAFQFQDYSPIVIMYPSVEYLKGKSLNKGTRINDFFLLKLDNFQPPLRRDSILKLNQHISDAIPHFLWTSA